jgi:hypothetical protein
MPTENDKRCERAEAALRAVPTHYAQTEEGITDAITDLTHLAAARGADIDTLLDRCRCNFETEAAETEERAPSRYAILVVLEAPSAEAAWEAVRHTAGNLQGEGEPDCIYIGAPWRGIPFGAEDIATERVELRMSVPEGGERYIPITAVLSPCE